MSRSLASRAQLGVLAAVAIAVAACGSTSAPSAAAPSTVVPAAQTPQATAAAVASHAVTAPTALATPEAQLYDTTSLGSLFALPITMRLPAGWIPLPPPTYGPAGTVGAVHGKLEGDDSTWWGFGFMLVDGASVLDPADLQDPQGNTKRPWPASYIDYLAKLPGVTVAEKPSPVTVGGIKGREITVTTPAMHPTIFLKGDYTWLGGGKSGIDPAAFRRVLELTVKGKRLLIEYDDAKRYEDRVQVVDDIIRTIQFPG
jgi:hypothetical protein